MIVVNDNLCVVVGIDGSSGSHQAVKYGALEASRQGVGLTLIHVVPDYTPVAAMRPVLPDLQDIARTMVSAAEVTAAETAPEVPVSSRLPTGHSVTELVRASAEARLVVLGHESTPAWARVFTGAVVMGVAARAACPVVAVPDRWRGTPRHDEIVVGFKSAHHDAHLLQHAFASAGARAARLIILHAWELPGCYDDMIARRTHDGEYAVTAREQIEDQIGRLRAEHQDVDVVIQVVHMQPALALRHATLQADLLMLARRGQGPPPLHLGATARALMRDSACPVEIIPHASVAGGADLELERAGGPLK